MGKCGLNGRRLLWRRHNFATQREAAFMIVVEKVKWHLYFFGSINLQIWSVALDAGAGDRQTGRGSQRLGETRRSPLARETNQ